MTRIQKAIARTVFATRVELIDVPTEGKKNRIVLLRAKEMPEYAFVMWAGDRRGTADQMVFSGADSFADSSQHTVVCACCEASWSEQSSEEHRDSAVKFQEQLTKICNANNIHTVFMRRAGAWEGKPKGFRVIETDRHRDTLQDDYGRKTINASLQFIDYRRSRGLD